MKTFGFKKQESKIIKFNFIKKINYFYVFLLLIFFNVFSMVNKISNVVGSENKLKEIENIIDDFVFQLGTTDKELSNILFDVKSVLNKYNNGENIIKTSEAELFIIIDYLKNKYNELNSFEEKIEKSFNIKLNLGLNDYKDFIKFVIDISKYKEDIFSILGKSQKQNYIIVLQNTSEKRPNGGFFGSFALLTIDGLKFDVEIIDSYLIPYVNPNAEIQTPDWAKDIIPHEKFGFISSNKFGFTDLDGNNIKKIYEKAFPEKTIRGVIFIKSDFFEKVIPGFSDKLIEWEFVNASIDLIRKENLSHKKELYLKEINNYFDVNKINIIKNIMKNFNLLFENNNCNIYISLISTEFNAFLKKNNLTNRYDDSKIFFWDKNDGFNKIDKFVNKLILIYDKNGFLVKETTNDVVDFSDYESGNYNIKIYYDLNIPKSYLIKIESLQDKYGIELTERENRILGTYPYSKTQGMIYFPKSFVIEKVQIYGNNYKIFNTGFSTNLKYDFIIDKNNGFKLIEISVKVN